MSGSNQDDESRPGLDRRRMVTDGLAALIGAAVVPAFLRPFMSVRAWAADPTPTPSPTPGSESGLKGRVIRLKQPRTATEIDPRFAPFVNEKLTYEVNFMGVIKAATVNVTFKQGMGEEFLSELEAKAKGVVGWASTTKRQVMKTRLKIMDTGGGKTRLVPTHFSRISEKPDKEYRSLQYFDYKDGYWYYTKFLNGKRKARRRTKIPAGVYYEDLVGFSYNLRAGCYGAAKPGDVIKIQGIPYNDASNYTIRVATAEQMKKEEKWISGVPGAAKLGLVEIEQKIFGFKPGLGMVLTDANLVPLGGKIADVVSYGDVSAILTDRKK